MIHVDKYVGKQFGRLTVTAFSHSTPRNDGRHWQHCFATVCTCGVEKKVMLNNLLNGSTTSCGCLKAEQASQRLKTHGKSNYPEFATWQNLRRRCYDEKNSRYKTYGGRGITVCPEWLHSFEQFYADMGPRPAGVTPSGKRPLYSIDRIDADGPYSKENCRWATWSTQSRNKSSSMRAITWDGRTQSVRQWAEELGIDRGVLYYRLSQGMPLERVFYQGKFSTTGAPRSAAEIL